MIRWAAGTNKGQPTVGDSDRQILDRLQQGLPLVAQPFEAVADDLGIDACTLMDRTRALESAGVVREISGTFDTRRLGYDSTLVAARIPADRLDRAVRAINAHPGVTHNYGRDHVLNVWFTLAVPADSTLGLARTVERLAGECGAEAVRSLPVVKVYKIRVRLPVWSPPGVADSGDGSSRPEAPQRRPAPPESDRRVVRALGCDLPVEAHPLVRLASAAGMDATDLLEGAQRLAETGVLRRLGAVLDHHRAGFGTNAMAVWAVPPERIDAAGMRAAACAWVSHCYRRQTHPDWPYNLFAMVHARRREECETVLADLAEAIGPAQHAVLYTTAEYKKTRLRYFTPAIAAWEAQPPSPR